MSRFCKLYISSESKLENIYVQRRNACKICESWYDIVMMMDRIGFARKSRRIKNDGLLFIYIFVCSAINITIAPIDK